MIVAIMRISAGTWLSAHGWVEGMELLVAAPLQIEPKQSSGLARAGRRLTADTKFSTLVVPLNLCGHDIRFDKTLMNSRMFGRGPSATERGAPKSLDSFFQRCSWGKVEMPESMAEFAEVGNCCGERGLGLSHSPLWSSALVFSTHSPASTTWPAGGLCHRLVCVQRFQVPLRPQIPSSAGSRGCPAEEGC